MKNFSQLKNPPMLVAMTALFVALGGTSYAAYSLPKNSVGAAQIKTAGVRTSEVKNGSLKAVDFAAGQLPAGAAGAPGPKGDKGDTGSFSTIVVRRKDYALADGQSTLDIADPTLANVECLPGEKLISGGGNLANVAHGDAKVTGSGPRNGTIADQKVVAQGGTPTIWRVTAFNPPGGDAAAVVVRVHAICAS